MATFLNMRFRLMCYVKNMRFTALVWHRFLYFEFEKSKQLSWSQLQSNMFIYIREEVSEMNGQ